MQIDNDIGERLDAASLGAEDQDGLSIIDKPPSSREAEFALVVGKEAGAAALRRNPVGRRSAGEETLNPGPLVADPQVEPRGG